MGSDQLWRPKVPWDRNVPDLQRKDAADETSAWLPTSALRTFYQAEGLHDWPIRNLKLSNGLRLIVARRNEGIANDFNMIVMRRTNFYSE